MKTQIIVFALVMALACAAPPPRVVKVSHFLESLKLELGDDYTPSHLLLPVCQECLMGTYHNWSDNKCVENPKTTDTETWVDKCAFYRTATIADEVTCSICEKGYGWVDPDNKCVNVVDSKNSKIFRNKIAKIF